MWGLHEISAKILDKPINCFPSRDAVVRLNGGSPGGLIARSASVARRADP
jgi:hypothetical protein